MQYTIAECACPLPRVVSALLPPALVAEISALAAAGVAAEEIRLRRGRCASVTANGINYRLSAVLSGTEAEALLLRMCEGSLYAHAETLREGYLTLSDGIRVGVCGNAALASGEITGLSAVTSFVIRLPRASPPLGGEVCTLLRQLSLTAGVLIFSPPAVGKTTLLRAVAAAMAGGEDAVRVALVDTRNELAAGLSDPALLLDVLSGYPKGAGIETAVRTLSAQLIVCDEIGDRAEAESILAAHAGGVPLLASAHAATLAELLARPGIRALHEARCFGAYVRIARKRDAFDFSYEITMREAAEDDKSDRILSASRLRRGVRYRAVR